MHTCTGWYAAIAAGPPNLLPAAVLACAALNIDALESNCTWEEEDAPFKRAYSAGIAHTLALLRQAANLPPFTMRVRIEGEAQVGAAGWVGTRVVM